jgi:hypothetical protein
MTARNDQSSAAYSAAVNGLGDVRPGVECFRHHFIRGQQSIHIRFRVAEFQ